MTTWITHDQAAEILGSHRSLVGKLIDRGLLHPRRTRGHHPSIDRAEVAALAKRRRLEKTERAERRRVREAAQKIQPHGDEHDWLSTSQAAALIGVGTPQAIVNRCNRGTLPCTWASGRRWIRRDLLEQVERANARRESRKI